MENKHGFLVINGQTIGLQSSPARINDYEVSKGSVWSSDKVNAELEDVRNELDVIVEESNKNTTISDGTTSLTTTWSSKKTSDELAKKEDVYVSTDYTNLLYKMSNNRNIDVTNNYQRFNVTVFHESGTSAEYNTVYKNGVRNYVEVVSENGLSLEWVSSTGSFKMVSYTTGLVYKVRYIGVCSDTIGDSLTNSIVRTNKNATLSDTSSTTSTYSSAKIDKKFAPRHFGTDNKTLYLKLQLGAMTTHEPITVTDQYGGQVKILGMYDLSTYKSVKVIRLSYGDWTTHSGTDFTNTSSGDANYKIRRLFYCPDDNNYYLEIRQYSYISVEGAPNATMVTSLPVDASAMTLIPESQFASKTDLATQTANRQVKTFDNSGSSTEKWYKLCSAITGGIGCNIKLTASRVDSTATVQYFSALFRDGRYRYTSTCLARERTVYESELVAEYSTYIVADANNDIWVHVPSYGKAIIEIDTRAITVDGTVGTPVKDYVYNSFRLQTIDESFERINIKQFNQPGSNTSFKYVTITSSGSGLGGLELNVPYAGKYMFSTPKSAPVYFGSSSHKGYTLNGWAWSDDGKTLYLRVAGFAPFSISVLGSVPNDMHVNNITTISDMTSTAPEGVTFVSTPVYSNAVINNSSTGDANSTWSSSKIASELKTSSNKELTEITFTNSTNWSNSSGNLKTFYMVRNGWCFLHVVAHCNKVANDNNSVVYSGLPIPPFQVYGKFVGEDNTYEPCNLTVATNGQMLLRGGTAGKDYSFTYTYPVA